MVRFAVNPSPKKGPSTERFAAQLALARVHPNLIALERTPGGYSVARDQTRGWFELRAKRGLAGYGLARALRMLLDVLAGITALEDTRTDSGQAFVHGELVPALLRVDSTGTTRLIALAPWHWSAQVALIPERCGYLAPERLLGDVIDCRADVFSAGVLLWEALAGRRLFATDSVDTIVTRLIGEKVAIPELPPELSWAIPLKAIAMCALSVDPEQRFANCAEMADAIGAVAAQQLATHADVLDYLRAPDPLARPSLSAPSPSLRPSSSALPPSPPAHISSLSALVAPLQASQPVPPSPSERAEPPMTGLARRARSSLWAIAATSCLLSALGASAIGRHRAVPAAASPVAEFRAPAVSVAPSSPVVPPPPTGSEAEALPLGRAAHARPSLVEVSPSVVDSKAASKMPNSRVRAKGTAPQPKLPAKPGRGYDRAAAKYGI